MKLFIILIIIFLVVVYLFTYIRYKKNKRHPINTVQQFHDTYLKQADRSSKESIDHSMDYLIKEELFSEIQAELHEQNNSVQTPKAKKKLHF